MTLSTNIIICEPVNPRELFDFALGLLGRGVDFPPRWEHKSTGGEHVTEPHYRSECGQGLAAWLWVHYANDGPLRLVRVMVDTVYGYEADNGAHCSDLHAWLVREVGGWLTERNVTKAVFNHEERDEWYALDEYARRGDAEKGAL